MTIFDIIAFLIGLSLIFSLINFYYKYKSRKQLKFKDNIIIIKKKKEKKWLRLFINKKK